MLGGTVGLVGLQKRSVRFLGYYAIVKAVQFVLILVSSILVLTYLDDIVPELVSEIIDAAREEAKEAGEPEPVLDRNLLESRMALTLWASSHVSISMWSTLGLYSIYIISSLRNKWQESPASNRRFVVSIPTNPTESSENQQGTRIQYATPLLQGQSPSIPVSVT